VLSYYPQQTAQIHHLDVHGMPQRMPVPQIQEQSPQQLPMLNIVITFQRLTAQRPQVVHGSAVNAHFSQDVHLLQSPQILIAKRFQIDVSQMEHIVLKSQHAVHLLNNFHVLRIQVAHIAIGIQKQMQPFQFVLMPIHVTNYQQH
jgi:hypothetical protein